MNKLIAITGGIGSGKSVVSEMLRAAGFHVYDCDREARRIMDSDRAMLERIFSEVAPEARSADGSLDRKALAAAVFADADKLACLNRIVHGAVRADLLRRSALHRVMFFESAILYSSGFYTAATAIWEITAPMEVRIERVIRRNGASREEVEARISSQRGETPPEGVSPLVMVNDGITPLLPQIERAIAEQNL